MSRNVFVMVLVMTLFISHSQAADADIGAVVVVAGVSTTLVSAETIWQGGATLILTCKNLVPTDCTWSQDRLLWSDFAKNLVIHGSFNLPSPEENGMKHFMSDIFLLGGMEFTSTTVRMYMSHAPGFVLKVRKEIVKLNYTGFNKYLALGALCQTCSQPDLLSTYISLMEIDLTKAPQRTRFHGRVFQSNPSFSEKDVRLSGFNMRISLMYDIWAKDMNDTQVSQSKINFNSFQSDLFVNSILPIRVDNDNPYDLTMILPAIPTFNIVEKAINKVNVQITFGELSTLRGSPVPPPGPPPGNFTIWAMPDLKCALKTTNIGVAQEVKGVTFVTEDIIRNGSLVVSIVLSGSVFSYRDPIPEPIRKMLLDGWTCKTLVTDKVGLFRTSQALTSSVVTLRGSILTFALAKDPLYDLNTEGTGDPEQCTFEIQQPLVLVDTTETCAEGNPMVLNINVAPGIMNMTVIADSTITEADIRRGRAMSIKYTLIGDKFESADLLSATMTWKSSVGTQPNGAFNDAKNEILPVSNFILSANETVLTILFNATKKYEIPRMEEVTVTIPAECFKSKNLPTSSTNKKSFIVLPVSSVLSYNQLFNVTKRNFTTGPMETLRVTLSGDEWTPIQINGITISFVDSIVVSESPSVPDGFLSTRYIVIASATTEPGSLNVLKIAFAQTPRYMYNRAQTITLFFPVSIMSSGILPSNGNSFTLNITEIPGTITHSLSKGNKQVFGEDEVRAGKATLTLVIADDSFLNAKVLNTLYMCADRAVCPIPMRELPLVSSVPACSGLICLNNTLELTLGSATFDVSRTVELTMEIPSRATASGLQPINKASFKIMVVPGKVTIGFDTNATSITEEMIRRGTAPTFYIELTFDSWIRDVDKVLDLMTSPSTKAITSKAANGFQANLETVISSLVIRGQRMYIYLQAAPEYDIDADEIVTFQIPGSIIASNEAPPERPTLLINVTQGTYYISGSFTAGVTSRDIKNPQGVELELIISLEGEKWVSTFLHRRIIESINGSSFDNGFNRLKVRLIPIESMSVNEQKTVVTFVLVHIQEYKITTSEVVRIFIPKDAVRSGIAPIAGSTSTVNITAVGGLLQISPETVNVTAVRLGLTFVITIKDGSTFSAPLMRSSLIYPAITSSSTVSEEPYGFVNSKKTLLPMNSLEQQFYTIDTDRLTIKMKPYPNYDINRREVIYIFVNKSWLTPPLDGLPVLEPEPASVSLAIMPKYQVVTCILKSDFVDWGNGVSGDSQQWIYNLTTALGINTERVVVERAERFKKFEPYASTYLLNYTSVTFHFVEADTSVERSPHELIDALRGFKKKYSMDAFRLVTLFTDDELVVEPDWKLYTPESPKPTAEPDRPADGTLIWLIAGVFVFLIISIYGVYKCCEEGKGVTGGYRERTIRNTDDDNEMKLIDDSSRDRTFEDEALRKMEGGSVHIGQKKADPSFHKGRQFNTLMSERSVPMVYAGQSRNVSSNPLDRDFNFRRENEPKENYLQQVLDEFGIPAGSIYPTNQTGPKFRPPSKFMQEDNDFY